MHLNRTHCPGHLTSAVTLGLLYSHRKSATWATVGTEVVESVVTAQRGLLGPRKHLAGIQ